MAFIGNTNTTQAFTPAIDYFSGNASTTAFTLSKPVASVAQVQVVVNNVAQNPSSAYTISGNTITFTSAPSAGTNNIYVYYTSPITQVIAPGQNTVYPSSLSTTNALYWDTSGNVGIGTTSPQFRFNSIQNVATAAPSVASSIQIYAKGYGGSAQQYAGIGFAMYEHTNGYWGSGILARDDTGSYGSALTFYTSTGSATPTPTERMRIDSSGNVGIGTTAPNKKLEVSDATDTQIRFTGTSTANGAQLVGYSNSDAVSFGVGGSTGGRFGATLAYIGSLTNVPMLFMTNSIERMRIDSSGVITSTLGGMQVISGTSVTASGTSVNFTSIPSWVKRITVQFIGVSGNGGSMPTVRLGDAGGIETTGYSGSTQTGTSAVLLSTGFDFAGTYQTAARVYHGAMTLTLQNSSTNTWAGTCIVGLSDGASVLLMGGTKSLSQTLDRVSITFTNGTDSFDAGTINILYE